MKVTGPAKPGSARGVQKTQDAKGSEGAFVVSSNIEQVSESARAAASAPVEMLSALIDLQSDQASRGKIIAAGRRALSMLDRIQSGLLDGRVHIKDLEALAESTAHATGSLSSGPDDQALVSLYNDISLRARVELAKLGR